MDKLLIIKIGGNIIDNDEKLSRFLEEFAALKEKKVLIHGGGKLAAALAEKLNIPQQVIDGRRITDSETLKIVTMVYAGYINKNIVAKLQSLHCNALGFTGADGHSITAHKRIHPTIDYGFVGDIDEIDINFINHLLEKNITPVAAPVTCTKEGQLLNTNADTIAQELAKSLSKLFDVQLIFSFEKNGVLENINDENSTIRIINHASYEKLKNDDKIFSGMIPKLDNAFSALKSGVKKVTIGKAEELKNLITGAAGTSIIYE